MNARRNIFSIGHGNHSSEIFFSLLEKHEIQMLIDVRARPVSRFAPWSNKKALDKEADARGLGYVYAGALAGGMPRSELPARPLTHADFDHRRESVEFLEGIDLIESAAVGRRAALFCAEVDPAKCHRSLLIAPALLERGWEVFHIYKDGALLRDQGPEPFFDFYTD